MTLSPLYVVDHGIMGEEKKLVKPNKDKAGGTMSNRPLIIQRN